MGGSTESKQAYKLRNNQKGLCKICPTPIYRDGYCEAHFEKWQTYSKKSRKKRILHRRKSGLCTRCGGPSPFFAQCADCKETPEARRARNQRQVERYAKEGRCTRCGVKKHEDDNKHVTCANCRERGFSRCA